MTLDDMILDWNTLREQHPDEDSRDYFDFVEQKVAHELIAHRPLFPEELVESSGLAGVMTEEQLLADRELLLTVAGAFSGGSIFDVHTKADGSRMDLIMTLDNVPIVFSCIMLDLLARLWHVSSGFDMGLILNFQDEESKDMVIKVLEPVLQGFFPDIVYFGWNCIASPESGGAEHSEAEESVRSIHGTSYLITGRPLENSEMYHLWELIQDLNSRPNDTVSVTFTEYIEDDTIECVKIRKSEHGYSMQLIINMEDFDWEKPLTLAADKIPSEAFFSLIEDLFLAGKTTDEIDYIVEHFVQI